MKKAYVQNIISIIKKNIVSYFAIMVLIFLCVHIFLAATYLIDDAYYSYNSCLDECKKYDVAVYIRDTIDDNMMDELKSLKGTDEISTSFYSSGYTDTKDGKIITDIVTIQDKQALPFELMGRLPKKKNEVALLTHAAEEYNIKIGDIVKISEDAYLYEEDFIVTGLFETSEVTWKSTSAYGTSKVSGSIINCIAYVNKNALNDNYINDNYVMLRNNSLRNLSRFSDEYRKICENYIDRIEDKLDQITNSYYYVEKWDETQGYYIINIFTFMTKVVARTLVLILFLIAIAIVISSLRRMILDQNDEIGTMKANGFTNSEIERIFLVYSISATLIGVIVGNVLATFVTEKCFILYLSSILVLKIGPFICKPFYVLLSFVLPLLIIILSTKICMSQTLKKETLDILNNKKVDTTKVYFYEKLSIFKKIPIFIQMIINNMLKDARRCIGIIFGITGSVLLLVCGLDINRNLQDGYNYQLKNDIKFNKLVYFKIDTNAKDEIEKILSDNNVDKALIQYTQLIIRNQRNKSNIFNTIVYDDKKDFSKMFKFNTMDGKNPAYKGIFLQNSYKENFNIGDHDYIKIRDLDGKYIYRRTSNYFYNYTLYTSAFVDKETYEDMFDTDSYMNAFAIECDDVKFKKIMKELNDVDGYLYYKDHDAVYKSAFDVTYNFLNSIMGIFIASSILLSFLVVLDLMKVNIMERKSEFLVLIVNGFTKKEIKNYVMLDMFIMILLGNILGLICGSLAGCFVLSQFACDDMLFMNRINFNALTISLLISIVICGIITKMSMKDIDVLYSKVL